MTATETHKLVVFFPTARLVGFFADFFNVGFGLKVIELHSKKSQINRKTTSDTFRKCSTFIGWDRQVGPASTMRFKGIIGGR
mmetsp:Transcript_49339/g.49700  ORF Transcript_49339/g.49700 Transcript_49339/m.49700 type:complete len:82 (+) Transcript_49339:474-719(+)